MKTTVSAIITLLGALTASATTVTYDFSTTNNNDGSYADTFKSNPSGYTVTEYGFQDNQNLAILNIAGLDSAVTLALEITGLEHGDSFTVSGLTSSQYSGGTSAPKASGTLLFTGGSSNDDAYFSVPSFSNYTYLAISSSDCDPSLNGVEATFAAGSIANIASAATPEPATMALVGFALVSVALTGRLRKKKSS